MKQKKGLFAVFIVSVLFFSFFTSVDAVDLPPLPTEFYGYVKINGEPAPEGTEIVAKCDGEVKGWLTLKEAGKYGGHDKFDEKLVVQHVEIGGEITFWIGGTKAAQTSKYVPGTFNLLNFSVETETANGEGEETVDIHSVKT